MQKIQEVVGGDRVVVRSDKPFSVKVLQETPDGSSELFVGPRSADLRITSFNVPDGYELVAVECDADSQTVIDVLPNRFQECPPEGLVKELEIDKPRTLQDIVVNEIARIMQQRGHIEDPETVEEANDFDLDDIWEDEDWSRITLVADEELVAQASGDETQPADTGAAPAPPAPADDVEQPREAVSGGQ